MRDMAAEQDRMRTHMAERDRLQSQAMAHADSADARLERLTAEMNAASGSRKMDAMAALLNEMVAQHRAMRQMRKQMGAMTGGAGMGPGMMRRQQPAPADSARR